MFQHVWQIITIDESDCPMELEYWRILGELDSAKHDMPAKPPGLRRYCVIAADRCVMTDSQWGSAKRSPVCRRPTPARYTPGKRCCQRVRHLSTMHAHHSTMQSASQRDLEPFTAISRALADVINLCVKPVAGRRNPSSGARRCAARRNPGVDVAVFGSGTASSAATRPSRATAPTPAAARRPAP